MSPWIRVLLQSLISGPGGLHTSMKTEPRQAFLPGLCFLILPFCDGLSLPADGAFHSPTAHRNA
jgi:hypothetical protein